MKKSDSQKLRELKVRYDALQDGAINLAGEMADMEVDNEDLHAKISKLEIMLIEQRGAIGYLEHKLKGMENDTN